MLHIQPDERKERLRYAEMEFVWRPMYSHLGSRAQVLGHIFYDFDTSPLDLLVLDRTNAFDPTDNHTASNKTEPDEQDSSHPRPDNLTQSYMEITDSEDQHLRGYIVDMSQYYLTNHLLMMVGKDVNFEKAEFYYQELERLITQFNSVNSDIKLQLSTLSTYSKQVGLQNPELWEYTYDMMPYSDDGNRYFTGQFSSRPSIKTAVRKASQVLHSANKLFVSQIVGKAHSKNHDAPYAFMRASQQLEEAVSDGSGSDVITGVSRSAIADQYIERIREAIDLNMAKMAQIVNDATMKITGIQSQNNTWAWCQLTNSSVPGGVQWSCPSMGNS